MDNHFMEFSTDGTIIHFLMTFYSIMRTDMLSKHQIKIVKYDVCKKWRKNTSLGSSL